MRIVEFLDAFFVCMKKVWTFFCIDKILSLSLPTKLDDYEEDEFLVESH